MKKQKNAFTTMMRGFLFLALTTSLFLTSCKGKKGDTGPAGPQGASGPQAKVFNFSCTFFPGDYFASYSGISGYQSGDVIIFYAKYEVLGGTAYWAPLPLDAAGVKFTPEFSESTGSGFINTEKSSGATGSPWSTTTTVAFKAVLIKASGMKAHPEVNIYDYGQVESKLLQ